MAEDKTPNLFLLGAPKTASTSLYDLLSKHPQIYCPSVKEPGFFTRHEVKPEIVAETPHLRSYDRYLSLYDAAGTEHQVRCDGSTSYLRHPKALAEIAERFPAAIAVALYRDPVDLVSSYHTYLVHEKWEDILTLEQAWNTQTERRAGKQIPRSARRPSSVVYSEVALLGQQIEAARDIFGDRLYVYSMMDVRNETARVMVELQAALGLTQHDLGPLPSLNPARKARVTTLNTVLKDPPVWVRHMKARIKTLLGVSSLGVRSRLETLNSVKQKRTVTTNFLIEPA